jgi:site-specific DNA-methyltransferase (adenine-specific)|nr:MAG TPA: adenine-specific methyltransferase [Caudoviricetes sp.]
MNNNENYKLYNGDCLEIMDKLIKGGVKVDAIITDPPYGTTACKWDSIIPLDGMWERLNKLIKDNAVICLFAQTPFDKVLGVSNLEMLRYEWIWEKEQGTGGLNAKRMPLKKHENILVFYKKLPTYNPQFTEGEPYVVKRPRVRGVYRGVGTIDGYISKNDGKRYPVSIIKFNRDVKNRYHPTQKPVALLEYLVKTYTNEGDVILDFTMGSGSTGVACLNLNRRFIGIELDKKYFNITKDRLETISRQRKLF